MYYCYQGGGTHPVIPLRFQPTGNPNAGEIWHGEIHVFEEEGEGAGRIKTDISNSFSFVPANWRDKWLTYEDCPHGTNLYTTTEEVKPADISAFLKDARNHRAELAVAAGTMPPDPHPPMFGAPPRNLQPPSPNEISDQPVDAVVGANPSGGKRKHKG